MIRLLLRLYPAGWRARYGDEFEALLEERPLGPFDVADILLAAIDARLSARGRAAASSHARSMVMTLRIGGYAALIGGPLWVIGVLGASVTGASSPWFGLVIVANVALLVALAGLSAFQARVHPAVVWAAFVIPAIGATVSGLGALAMAVRPDEPIVGDWSGWSLWAAGSLAMFVGSALFAGATWSTRTLSRPGALLLAVSSLVIVPVAGGIAGGGSSVPIDGLIFAATFIAFAGGWATLGVSALRTPGRAMSSAAGAA